MLDDTDQRPVYLRLRDHIAAMILGGEYEDGDALPSVRAFARQWGANPLTVAKAYQVFQEDELIIVKRGVGTFIAKGATERLKQSERERFLSCAWPKIHRLICRLDLKPEELLRVTQNGQDIVSS